MEGLEVGVEAFSEILFVGYKALCLTAGDRLHGILEGLGGDAALCMSFQFQGSLGRLAFSDLFDLLITYCHYCEAVAELGLFLLCELESKICSGV